MGTYVWNILLFQDFIPAKSRARRRRPAAQAAPSQAVHRNLATGPNLDGIVLIHVEHLIVSLDQLSLQTTVLTPIIWWFRSVSRPCMGVGGQVD